MPHPDAYPISMRSDQPGLIEAPSEQSKNPLKDFVSKSATKEGQAPFTEHQEPKNHEVSSLLSETCGSLCGRFGHSPPLQGPQHIRDNLMGVDILSREAQWQEATGDKLAVTPSVEAELVLVAVVGVAVQLYDHPSLDHQVHLADALNLHSVLEAQSCSMQIHSRQRLQRGTGPVTGAIESCERPSRARATKQIANLLGSDALVVKCRIESDEWGVVLEVTAQKTRHSLRKWLHREASRGCWTLVPIHVENLTSHGCESSAIRNHKMNLLSPLGHRQTVVVHGGLTSEEPAMNAGQDNGAFGARDTDNTMLVGDELTGSHERSDMTALGASQLKIPNAHCSVAAANNGEQVSIHGAHDAHCHPSAEWAQHGAGVLWITGASISLWPP